MSSDVQMDQLLPGKKYRIRYKLESGNYRWYEWECVCTYTGEEKDEYRHRIVTSGRPVYGTGWIDKSNILEIERVPDLSNIRTPKKLGPWTNG